MAAQVWETNDAGWKQWLISHPQGFMANTHRPVGGHYYKIHAATCPLADRSKPETSNPRTGNFYLKVTGETLEELEGWAKVHLGLTVDPKNYCKRCAPNAGS